MSLPFFFPSHISTSSSSPFFLPFFPFFPFQFFSTFDAFLQLSLFPYLYPSSHYFTLSISLVFFFFPPLMYQTPSLPSISLLSFRFRSFLVLLLFPFFFSVHFPINILLPLISLHQRFSRFFFPPLIHQVPSSLPLLPSFPSASVPFWLFSCFLLLLSSFPYILLFPFNSL